MPGILEKRLSASPEPDDDQNDSMQDKYEADDEYFSEDAEYPEDEYRTQDNITKAEGKKTRKKRKQNKKQKAVSRYAEEDDIEQADIRASEGTLTEEDVHDLEEIEQIMSEEVSAAQEKRRHHVKIASQVILSLACIYLVMLIFGALITEYHYNDNGEIEPIILSVSEIQEKNEFNTVLSLYTQEKTLYERILVLDYRVAAGQEDTMTIAPEYEEALDTVSILATQIEGADIASSYNQVCSTMLTWVQTHLAAYCQYMSQAITNNDSDAAAEAIAARSVVYSTFQTITENIITLGDGIEVFDMTEIKNWSPENYIAETIEEAE